MVVKVVELEVVQDQEDLVVVDKVGVLLLQLLVIHLLQIRHKVILEV